MFQSLKDFRYLTLSLVALLLFTIACNTASQNASVSMTPEQLEAEAQAIDEGLICPSCPGKTIGQAQVAQAAQMRLLVREKLAEGWSSQQILDYFAERYEGVLAEPPKSGFTLLAWLLPIVGIVGGGGVLYLVVRAMRRNPESKASDAELEQYLERVDRDLGLSAPESGTGPTTPPADSGEV